MFEGYNYIDKTGKGAKTRFTNPAAVRAIYEHLSTEDLKEAERRAKIRGLYDGNLPYNPKDLASRSQRNLTNVNWLGLKGVIDNRADVILRLESDTANLIELRPIARELAGPDAAKIGSVVAEEFSSMLRENGRFIPAIARMNKEADLHGLGPITWSTGIDYCPIALERGQIRFIGTGPVSSSEHELFMFESTLTASFLRFLLDNEEMASQEGWNIQQVKEWLVRAYYQGESTRNAPGTEGSTSLIESGLSFVRRNVLSEDHQFEDLHVIHVFVKEVAWPRGITHLMMPSSAENSFLYEKQNAYRTMDECFLWFPYSVKERYAREVRGLASFLFAKEKLANRFKCKFVDAGFLASTVFLQQQSGSLPAQQLSINESHSYTVLPPGVTAAQGQVRPDIQGLQAVVDMLDQQGIASVTGVSKGPVATTGPDVFKGSSKTPTKDELLLQQRQKSLQDEAEFSQRQDVLNKICRQSFLRALRLAFANPIERVDFPEIDEWVRRCEMRGVTLEQMATIPELFTIVACRDLALGSEGKIAELDMFVQLYGGTIDESGRKFIARERARLRFGQRDADNIIPEVTRDQAPSDQASFATMENNQMKMGFEVMVGQDQLHWSHIPIHSKLLQEIVDMVRAPEDNTPELNEFNGDPVQTQSIAEQTLANLQDDPRKILGIFTMASQHVQEHVAIGGMQVGMEGSAKQVAKMLRDLRPTVKALNLAVATQERQEQAQREKQEREMQELRDRADQTELEKAKYEIDRKTEVEKYRVDKEDEVARERLAREAQRGEAQDSIAAARAAGDEARRDRETESRIEAQRQMSRAKINAANAAARFDTVNNITGMDTVSPGDIAEQGPLAYESL